MYDTLGIQASQPPSLPASKPPSLLASCRLGFPAFRLYAARFFDTVYFRLVYVAEAVMARKLVTRILRLPGELGILETPEETCGIDLDNDWWIYPNPWNPEEDDAVYEDKVNHAKTPSAKILFPQHRNRAAAARNPSIRVLVASSLRSGNWGLANIGHKRQSYRGLFDDRGKGSPKVVDRPSKQSYARSPGSANASRRRH